MDAVFVLRTNFRLSNFRFRLKVKTLKQGLFVTRTSRISFATYNKLA